MILEMPVGVLIVGCTYIAIQLLLFGESIAYRDFMQKHYAKLTRRLPLFGIDDLNVYSAATFTLCLASIFMVLGLILKRHTLMWPWILVAFQNLANYGYLMLEYFFWWRVEGATDRIMHVCLLPAMTFFIQLIFYSMGLCYFRRLMYDNQRAHHCAGVADDKQSWNVL